MDGLFLKVLEMSVTMLARFLLRKRSKRFIMILWAVVAFRLLVPFSFESSFSFFNFLPLNTQTLTEITEVHDAALPDNLADTQAVTADHAANTEQQESIRTGTAVNYGDETLSVNLTTSDTLPDIKTILSTVWLTGALGITAFCSVQFIMLKRQLRNSKHISGNVYVSDKISAPFVFGLFIPRIYLPDVLDKHEKEYILLHERTHIKHGAWLAYKLFEQDIEMNCDESVVEGMDADLKQAYTMSIVSFAMQSKAKRYLVTPLGFSKANISKTEVTNRVKNIINFKKGKTATAIAITAVLLFVSAGCALNSKAVASSEPEVTETEVSLTEITETEETGEQSEAYEGGRIWRLDVDGPKDFAAFAKALIGTPYAEGGNHPDIGLDGIGLVTYCYKEYYGLSVPFDVEEITLGVDGAYDSVSVSAIQVGDVVVYDSGNIAIYVGNGEVVYASETEGCVCSGTLTMEDISAIIHYVDYSISDIGVG